MKTLALFSILFLAVYFAAGQTKVTRDQSGNYVTLSATSGKESVKKETGKTLTLKTGEKLPVYESANGKLFVERKSKKTGNVYRQYLITE